MPTLPYTTHRMCTTDPRVVAGERSCCHLWGHTVMAVCTREALRESSPTHPVITRVLNGTSHGCRVTVEKLEGCLTPLKGSQRWAAAELKPFFQLWK